MFMLICRQDHLKPLPATSHRGLPTMGNMGRDGNKAAAIVSPLLPPQPVSRPAPPPKMPKVAVPEEARQSISPPSSTSILQNRLLQDQFAFPAINNGSVTSLLSAQQVPTYKGLSRNDVIRAYLIDKLDK